MRNSFWIFLFFSCVINAQEISYSLTGNLNGFYAAQDELPFWFYSNQNGQLDLESNFLGSIDAKARYDINTKLSLEGGAHFFYSDGIEDQIKRNELFIRFNSPYVKATLGAKNPEVNVSGLSSSNQNFIVSGNARALPGILVEANKEIPVFKFLSLDWGIGHYEMNDDRFVDGTMVHYKRLGATIKINSKNKLYARLQHYAQWGGTSPIYGDFPDDFEAFIDVFFARKGGEETTAGDQFNAVGNHLGSYFLEYQYNHDLYILKLYHDHPFEDGSGTRLANFPDGIWGAFLELKSNKFIKSVLYEYVDSSDQSGAVGSSSKDHYFMNKGYRSGWTYDGNTIGLPFISVPDNTRVRAHHISVNSVYNSFVFQLKASYVTNLGSYFVPFEPEENVLRTYLNTQYTLGQYGTFGVLLGLDASDITDTQFGAGISYSYQFSN